MTIIHMETESVESILRQMRSAMFDFESYLQRLQRARQRLSDAWLAGATSTDFLEKLETNLQKLAASRVDLESLERRLSYELAEWTEAAACLDGAAGAGLAGGTASGKIPLYFLEGIRDMVCGPMSGSDKARCESIWNSPPGNAEQLAYMIMSLPASMPIVILQIGDGKYLVLMRGTTGGVDEGSNWGSAAEAMFGTSSYQNSVVRALTEANLPPNAELHFAGHSQGGMIAQNLAVDPRITDNFQVKTVTMFGSPDTFAAANPDVRYVSFEAPMDVVPHLDEGVSSVLGIEALRGDVVAASQIPRFNDVDSIAEVHVVNNVPEAYSLDQNVSHSVYDNEGVLADNDIPFEADTWQAVQTSESSVSTIGPRIYKEVVHVRDAAGYVIEKVKGLAGF